MLNQLVIETFEPLVGTSFWLHDGGRKVEMQLVKALKVMESEAAQLKRTPFSLFFHGPVLLPQQIYPLTHEAFSDPLEIFLVPVGKEGNAIVYEAVFT